MRLLPPTGRTTVRDHALIFPLRAGNERLVAAQPIPVAPASLAREP
jgi:hypothetical protein